MDVKPIRFIARRIEVEFAEPPLFEKIPPCPNRFVWNEETFDVVAVLTQWDDFSGRTMHSHQAGLAQARGSWGQGRVYFRVETESGRIFDLYYDRAPRDVDDRKGSWILFREMEAVAAGEDADTDASDTEEKS